MSLIIGYVVFCICVVLWCALVILVARLGGRIGRLIADMTATPSTDAPERREE